MKVRFIDQGQIMDLEPGKIYDVISVELDWYRIIDESEEDYLYPPEFFEIVE